MTLKFTNVTVDVINKNRTHASKYLRLVDNISGEFHYNELTAIMGPSGCGKSTLIASLVGRIQTGSKTSGSITIDGKERDYRPFINSVGMLEQDDNIFPHLTLYETLSYTIEFHGIKPKQGKDAYIDEVLRGCGLKDSKLNHMVKLSGGQRKRAMLAIELVTDPNIIFADEPTSGLDTTTAFNIMQLLKAEAKKGKMVVVCIHQPSTKIYELFDNIMLMAEAQVVYHGPAANFENFLKSKNIMNESGGSFPDFIVDMVVKENNFCEDNTNYPIVQQLIADNHVPKNNDLRIRKQNDTMHDYRINFRHIWLIQSRVWKLTLQNKFQMIKSIAIYTLISLVILLMNNAIYKNASENYKQPKLVNYLHMENATGADLAIQSQLVFILSRLMTVFYLSFFIGCILASSTGAFYNSSSIIKREISAGCYSSTNYVLGLYAFHILRIILFLAPSTLLFISKYTTRVKLSIFIVHFLAPIFLIPVSFAIGSISKNKKVVLAITSFLTIPMILPPEIIFELILASTGIKTKTLKYLALGLIGLLSFSPTFYFSAFYLLLQKYLFASSHALPEEFNCFDLSTYYALLVAELKSNENINNIYAYIYMSRVSMISIFVGITMLVMLFALWRQSRYLMPAIRMKL